MGMEHAVKAETIMGALDASPIRVGKVYVHVKTNHQYTVETLAVLEADLSPVVVYRRIDGGPAFVRPHHEFVEKFRRLE